MAGYEDLYQKVSDTIWDAFKNSPPEENVLKKSILAQLEFQIEYNLDCADLKSIDRDEFASSMTKDYWTRNAVRQKEGNYLFSSEAGEPWLPAAEENGDIEWHYWKQYRHYLERDMHWSSNVCNQIEDDTWKILSKTHDLNDDPFSTQGLVIGNVQSGKTANYLGLLCRAADAGYKYLVVLASTTNDLREQTQKRIEEGFIGICLKRDEQNKNAYIPAYVGVGDGAKDDFQHPNPGTTREDDFKKKKMETFLHIGSDNVKEPWIFIIKKNKSTLENLTTWLRQQSRGKDDKLFLIDDEADYASINTQYSKEKISTINRLIRDLYNMFQCRTYIGYTATPYANILVDRDVNDDQYGEDFFPKHFIFTLSPATSYFGADKVFADVDPDEEGIGRCKYLRFVTDCLPPSKKDVVIDTLPESLKDAIRTFLIAATIWKKRLAGRHKNMTMLINVSQFNIIQEQFQRLIDFYLRDSLRPALQLYSALPSNQAAANSEEIQQLNHIWSIEYSESCEFTWETILPGLLDTCLKMSTALIHHKSKDVLDYDTNDECVIAIGGNRLSRGLTLDGLMISYFTRNSKAYDTLMQMSRWFGHRVEYEDLCRVWMTSESAGWCRFISDSTNDLLIDLARMQRKGATPSEFGLKIKAHPSTLMVTARNKMGASELRRNIELDGKYVETFALLRDKKKVLSNHDAVNYLLEQLEKLGLPHERFKDEDGYLGTFISDVPVAVIEEFIGVFENCDDSKATKTENILRHIGYCKDEGKRTWDVLIAASTGEQSKSTFSCFGEGLFYERRSPGVPIFPEKIFVGNRNKVSTKHIERAGLSAEQLLRAKQEYKKHQEETPHPSFDRLCRECRSRPLLVIHHLDMKFTSRSYDDAVEIGNKRTNQKLDSNLWRKNDHELHVAWSISFPVLEIEKENEYVFNKVALENMYYGNDGPDEDDGTDEKDE